MKKLKHQVVDDEVSFYGSEAPSEEPVRFT
jgi:hypothetical protein